MPVTQRRSPLLPLGAAAALVLGGLAYLATRPSGEPAVGSVAPRAEAPRAKDDPAGPAPGLADASAVDGLRAAGAQGVRRALAGGEEPPAAQVLVAGRVRARSGGAPIDGAEVLWRAPGAADRRVVADAEGRFELAWPLAAVGARIEVGAPGWVSERRVAPDADAPLEILLERAAELLVDLAPVPHGSGTVWLWRQDAWSVWTRVEIHEDRPGRYRAEGLAPGDYALAGWFERHFVPLRQGVRVAEGDSLYLRLEPAEGARVDVRVRDTRGAAVGDARVRLEPARGGGPRFMERELGERSTSADDGRVHFGGLPAGEWTVRAESPWGGLASANVNVAAGDLALDLELVVPASANLGGRVVDGAGRPVAGAPVRGRIADPLDGRGQSWREGVRATTANDGSFLLEGLPERGRLLLEAWPPAELEDRLAATRLRTGRGERGEIELTLAPLGRIEGRVTSSLGGPLAGASVQVELVPQGGGPRRRLGDARTDEDGRFAVEGLPSEGHALRVVARADRHRARAVSVSADGLGQVEIELSPEIGLSGRLVDETGAAVARQPVSLRESSTDGSGRRRSATSDAFGRFQFAGLAPGAYEIAVWGQRWILGSGEWSAVDLPRDEPLDLVLVPRDRPPAAVLIAAVEAREDGGPVPGARVRGPRGGTPVLAGTRLEWSGILPGSYGATLRAPGRQALDLGRLDFAPGAELDLGTLRLARGESFQVEIEPPADWEGGPLPIRARLVPRPADEGGPQTRAPVLDLGGDRQNRRLGTGEAAPGRWRLEVDSAEFAPVRRNVELPRQGGLRVRLERRS